MRISCRNFCEWTIQKHKGVLLFATRPTYLFAFFGYHTDGKPHTDRHSNQHRKQEKPGEMVGFLRGRFFRYYRYFIIAVVTATTQIHVYMAVVAEYFTTVHTSFPMVGGILLPLGENMGGQGSGQRSHVRGLTV